MNEYLNIIIRTNNVDIIVFPESSLNSIETAVFVPEPEENIVPCSNSSYSELMDKISCAAGLARKYVVINVKEISVCPDKQQIEFGDTRPCTNTNTKTNIYNTNVVFARNGQVVSKYRKFNLFGENGVKKPLNAVTTTFDTDFGVRFGHFICFDLMFQTPAIDLVQQENVRDIIFTANWFSELPFLNAVQIQQAWAYANNVNLLAAGGNFPPQGSGGSGIYHGTFGTLTAGFYPTTTRYFKY